MNVVLKEPHPNAMEWDARQRYSSRTFGIVMFGRKPKDENTGSVTADYMFTFAHMLPELSAAIERLAERDASAKLAQRPAAQTR